MRKKKDLPESELMARYLAGESTPELAKAYGVCQTTIWRRLSKLGVDTRTRSEGQILAHTARADSTKIGKYELECVQWLEELGYKPRVQVNQSNKYLIDIVVGGFAIEVWAAHFNPSSDKKQSKKIAYLIEQGWDVVYLWSGRNSTITRETIAELDTYMLNHNGAPGSYYCIRGQRVSKS